MSFKNGGHVNESLKEIGNTNRTGTSVTFKPDQEVFKAGVQFNFETIVERMRESAFLEKNLKVSIKDEKTDRTEEFHYEKGLISFINFLHEGKELSLIHI